MTTSAQFHRGPNSQSRVRLAYLVSHPIQYQAPLLRRIALETGIDLTVLFGSDFSVRGYKDHGFGVEIAWDTPLLEGYCSDFGRTVHIGEPSAEFRRAYSTVIAAHDAAIVAMKVGAITAERANAIARAVVEDAGYGEHFRHRLGHGIGLDVHEGPFLTEGDTTVLREGMAFTVEPSIYWIGRIGARIEDVVIVRPDGGETLNQALNTLHVVA